MNYLESQLWNGKAKYILVRAGQFVEAWAPYAQLDFAACSVASAPDEEFEKRAVGVAVALAMQGRPFLLVMLDEAMNRMWRGYQRHELLLIARHIVDTVPASSAFAVAEYALVRHILHSESAGIELESEHLDQAVDGRNPFAAGARALIRIRNDYANAFPATLYAARLGNRVAAHQYVVQHYQHRPGRDEVGSQCAQLRELLMELALQDDPVALLDLALASRRDLDAMLLSAAAGNWQALWNLQNDDDFSVTDELRDVCRSLQSCDIDLKAANARLMQSTLLSCWDSLRLGN